MSKKSQLKLPGLPKEDKSLRAEVILKLAPNAIVNKLTLSELNILLKKKKPMSVFDFSSPQFELDSVSFLKQCTDTIKMYVNVYIPTNLPNQEPLNRLNLKGNMLEDLGDGRVLSHLSKLKALVLSNNNLSNLSLLGGLKSLEYLDLSNNNIEHLPQFSGLDSLTYLDISGNPIKGMVILMSLGCMGLILYRRTF